MNGIAAEFTRTINRLFTLVVFFAVMMASPVWGKRTVPHGFIPLPELKEARARAEKEKELLILVVKGDDDQCPNCAAAMENGLKAIGSGVVKVFSRVDEIRKADTSEFPESLKMRLKKSLTGGAYVTFIVFKPDMSEIITEAGRKELQNDKKAISAFKKDVQAAKKTFKGN